MLDTNVILKALIRDSVVRGIILHSSDEFLIPEYAIDETRKHLDMVAEKSGISESEITTVIDALLMNIKVIPAERVLSKWKEAEAVMARIDMGDVPFVAAAMSVNCDGVWSDDRHLRRQDKVRVWTTKEIVGLSHTQGSLRLRRGSASDRPFTVK